MTSLTAYYSCADISLKENIKLKYTLCKPHMSLSPPHIGIYCTLHTAHNTLYTAYCTLYIVHCILHTIHCTLHTTSHIYLLISPCAPTPPPQVYIESQRRKCFLISPHIIPLQVCREFQRGKCSREADECRYAHPPSHVSIENGHVTACFDSLKVRFTHYHSDIDIIILCILSYFVYIWH